MTDYEKWKEWLDQWGVHYEEQMWNLHNQKVLATDGFYCQAAAVFDLDENFITLTAYE